MANIIKLIDTKPAIDWERIELDYRAGLLSIREVAAAHGITHGAIQKHAKKNKWVRDLKARIRAKADSLVAKHEVAKLVATETTITELATIEANAQRIADIRMAHRTDIVRYRNLTNSMLMELEAVTGDNELFSKLGELMLDTAEGESASEYQKKRMEALNKVLSLSSRIDSLKRLAETLKTLITLEREAYSIGENTEDNEKEVKQVKTFDAEYWVHYQTRITETLGIVAKKRLTN